jgi:hypothetical protein
MAADKPDSNNARGDERLLCSEETPMVRLGRSRVRISVLIGCLLLAAGAASGAYLVLKPSEPDMRQDGFLAHGQILVAIAGNEVNTRQSRRCIANSILARTSIRQGIPVIISLDDNAVGGGFLSTGRFERERLKRGSSESLRASCLYKFSAPVTQPGTGQYAVEIGHAKIAFSMDDLRNGIRLNLS